MQRHLSLELHRTCVLALRACTGRARGAGGGGGSRSEAEAEAEAEAEGEERDLVSYARRR